MRSTMPSVSRAVSRPRRASSESMKITFDASELDQALWESRSRREAEFIYANPNTRNGRTLDEVYLDCKRGQAPEVWLISKGFKDDPRPYRDVRRPDGEPIEVKATDWNPRYILERYAEKIKHWPDETPTTVYLFNNTKGDSLYTFHGIFHWNGTWFDGVRPTL